MPTKLTAKRIQKAIVEAREPGAKRIILRDETVPGLRLVCGPRGGSWTFSTTVRTGGVRRESFTTLGPVEAVSLDEAREQVRQLKGSIRAGHDPQVERRLAQARATTLAREAAGWRPRGRDRHAAADRGNLLLALKELSLTDAAPGKLTRRDVLRLIEMHIKRPGTARARLGALRRFMDSLVDREVISDNPVRQLPQRAVPAPPPSRSRYPSAAEIQALWRATENLLPRHRDMIRVLLLLPLRRGEAASLVASEVDVGRREIRLSASRTKNGKPFTMPLSDAALAILQPLVEAAPSPDTRLFGGTAERFDFHRLMERLRRISGVQNFSLHDMRRCFASEAAEHDLADFGDIDALLAHSASASLPGVAAVYHRGKRVAQRHRIMARWGELVGHAVEHAVWPREVEQEATVVDLDERRAKPR